MSAVFLIYPNKAYLSLGLCWSICWSIISLDLK